MVHLSPIKPALRIVSWAVGGILFSPLPALAVQAHGHPEGLYVHQLGHLAFLVSMLYIWFRTRKRRGAGWVFIRLAFVLFALWNVNTFLIHAIQVSLSPGQFVGRIGGLPRYFQPRSALEVYYYFGKMDHLLCVPAAFFLAMGLRRMGRQPEDASHHEF